MATLWSSMPVGVSDVDVVAAWTGAASSVWKDEVHVSQQEGGARAAFLYNSGHVRMTVCECTLSVAPVWTTTHFLTSVTEVAYELNLGWALHTRTLDALAPQWPNPFFGEEAVRRWSEHERLRRRAQGA